ncbi:hypothetical protein [Anoxybacillus thermarum]
MLQAAFEKELEFIKKLIMEEIVLLHVDETYVRAYQALRTTWAEVGNQKQVRATVTTLTCPFLAQSTCNKGTSCFIVLHDVSRLFTFVEREICESIHRACVGQRAYSSCQDGASIP